MRRVTLVLVLALAAPGCSVIARGSDYLTDAGTVDRADARVDGSTDGAIDSGPPSNRPPLASGVGLSSHSPHLGDTLHAFVGPVHDPDGDSVVTELVWFKNGEELEDVTGPALLLDSSFAVGDEIHVELTTEDAEDEGSVATSGVAVIDADETTTWRLLLPPRSFDTMHAFDRARQRLLLWSRGVRAAEDHGLWEMQLVLSGTPRWVRVQERGTRPVAQEGVVLYDGANQRILYYGGRLDDDASDALFALDLSERGRESWSQLAATTPPARQAASVALSEDGTRAWIYGGIFGNDAGMRDDVWEVDITEAQFTSVLGATGSPVVGAALIHDSGRNRLIRVGGGAFTGEMPTPDDEIGVIDLAAGTYTAVGSLPFALLGARGVVEGSTAYVFLGVTDGFAPNTQVLAIDLTDLSVTPMGGAAGPVGILPIAESRAPFADGYVVATQGFGGDGSSDFYALDAEAASYTVLTAAGHDLPTRSMQGVSRTDREGRVWIYGGRQGTREGHDVPVPDFLWRVGQDDTFERVTLDPLPGAGRPEPRWGIVWDGSHEHPWPEIWQLLGRSGANFFSPDVWNISGDRWSKPGITSALHPEPRIGFSLFPGGCAGPEGGVTRGNVIGLVSGENAETGTALTDTWMLSCELPAPGGATGPSNCRWSNSVLVASGQPSARAWAASAIAGSDESARNRYVWLFGGQDLATSSALGELRVLDNCVGEGYEGAWLPAVVEAGSPVPSPRWGHSMSHVRVPAGAPATDPSTILLFAGGTDESGRSVNSDVWRIVPTGPFDPVSGPPMRYEQVTTTGPQPVPRMFHVAAWDPVQRRLLVYGGYVDERAMDDLWELRVRP